VLQENICVNTVTKSENQKVPRVCSNYSDILEELGKLKVVHLKLLISKNLASVAQQTNGV